MKKKLKKRERTVANLEKAKAEAEDNFGFIPTEAKIWKSLKKQRPVSTTEVLPVDAHP
jgi:hypothetical protein